MTCEGIVCAIQQVIAGGAAGMTLAALALFGFLLLVGAVLWWTRT